MDARELLHHLAGAGFTVAADGDRLTVSPASKLTDELRAALRTAKLELLAILAERTTTEPAPPRTCADCRHRLRPGTCGEPVAAGLFTAAHGFGIVWPEPDHAATCPAFAARIASPRSPAMRTETPLPHHPRTNGETK